MRARSKIMLPFVSLEFGFWGGFGDNHGITQSELSVWSQIHYLCTFSQKKSNNWSNLPVTLNQPKLDSVVPWLAGKYKRFASLIMDEGECNMAELVHLCWCSNLILNHAAWVCICVGMSCLDIGTAVSAGRGRGCCWGGYLRAQQW